MTKGVGAASATLLAHSGTEELSQLADTARICTAPSVARLTVE